MFYGWRKTLYSCSHTSNYIEVLGIYLLGSITNPNFQHSINANTLGAITQANPNMPKTMDQTSWAKRVMK